MSKDVADFVLPNGFCFLAVTLGDYGMWRKARDPITAIRDAFRARGNRGSVPVAVYYGKHEELGCSGFSGSVTWTEGGTMPAVVGIYKVTERSIKPLQRGDFNEDHDDIFDWMNDMIGEIERRYQQ